MAQWLVAASAWCGVASGGSSYISHVVTRPAYRDESRLFAEAVRGLGELRVRPEVTVTEVPAPTRIAPHALALTAEVIPSPDEEPLASGRFVVLHDPAAPEAWEGGTWRIVSYARAQMEPELASDPMLGEVGWSWLIESLTQAGVSAEALGGTVTRVVSESFASLAHRDPSIELELRASWTPTGEDLADQLRAWVDLLCTIGGLPPLPSGVAALPGRRR